MTSLAGKGKIVSSGAQCLASEIPFADSSTSTDYPLTPNTSFHVLDQSMSHLDASTLSILTPGNYTYACLNTQYLIPKWEEVQDFLERAPVNSSLH